MLHREIRHVVQVIRIMRIVPLTGIKSVLVPEHVRCCLEKVLLDALFRDDHIAFDLVRWEKKNEARYVYCSDQRQLVR